MRMLRLLLPLSLALVACGSPALIGMPCKSNGDCASMMCAPSGTCTSTCTAQTDCPVGFDCGLARAGDATPTCYARTYDQTAPAMGGFGGNCTNFSSDPSKPMDTCAMGATNPCASGFTCTAARRCDPNAYCTKGCMADTDCPPDMFCGTPRTCTTDMTTQQVTCVPDKAHAQCMRRSFCEPCVTDDQCYQLRSDGTYDTGWACAVDANNEHYCGKRCNDSNNCPQPANDQNGFVNGDAFETCQPATAGSSVKVCAPANGYCHGKSTAMDQPAGGYCSGCRPGHPEDCSAGTFCYTDEFTTERWCTNVCTIELTFVKSSTSYKTTPGTDSCQKISPNLYCVWDPTGAIENCCQFDNQGRITSCDPMCTYTSLCGTDSNNYAITCYPYTQM